MRIEEKIREVIKRYGRELLKYPNVIGFSNTPQKRIRRGQVVDELVLRVYVTKKLPENMLRKDEVIPKEIDGVKTDVVELGRLRKMQGFRERYRPAPAGVSTSRADEKAAGTIGWFMIDEDGNVYLLSNNHVWAKENQGQQGDELLQPGVLDGGEPGQDTIAYLYDFIELDFSGNPNTVDVAIAEPVELSQVYMSIMDVGGITGKREPQENENVMKIGRSTGLTKGTVIDTDATLNIDYDSGTALFQDVFVVQGGETIVEPGDSGSPVLGDDGAFLGLLFAGSEDGKTFVACKATNIETTLQQKMNKKIWIMPVNSWPPFQKQIEIQKVYPSSLEVMAMSFNMTIQLMTYAVLLGIIKYIMKRNI